MVGKKDPENMEESELREELKKLYKKINNLSADEIAEMDFQGRVIIKKRNKDDEVVEEHEVEF